MTTETLPATTAPAPTTRRRKPRGQYPKKPSNRLKHSGRNSRSTLRPTSPGSYQSIRRPRARLLMLEQWRAGLRVSEALALEVSDLSLDVTLPTIRVRSGKGRKARVVPVHPELGAAFQTALAYGNVSEGRIIDVHRSTAWRWVQRAHARAEQLGAIPLGGGQHAHVSPQLRTTSTDERHSYQLPQPMAWAQLDPDDAHLPGASAGSVW